MSGMHHVYTGRFIVLQGPSGSGKSTIIDSLVERHPELRMTISSTTRPQRPGEIDGVHYHFISRELFEEQIDAGLFAEYAEYGGDYYGTHRSEVEPGLAGGRVLIGDVDINGVRQLIEFYGSILIVYVQLVTGESRSIDAELLDLRLRIMARSPELTGEQVAARIKAARAERSLMDQKPFIDWRERRVVNRNLVSAIDEVEHQIVLPCLQALA